jgi:lysophospholipase L1-like esterase
MGAAVLIICAATPLAARAAAPAVKPGSGYLALGDSVTFGFMEQDVVPPPNYRNPRSFIPYPAQLGAELRLRVANAACPGETSASLINPNAPSNGCENHPPPRTDMVYRPRFPLHVRYRGSQLSYAVGYLRSHRNVRLVSLMLGANDLFRCQTVTRDGCVGELRAALGQIGRNVRRIVSEIRHKGRYRGQLVIVNYYSLNYASAFINGVVRMLNNTVDGAARPFKVQIADGFQEFKAGSAHSGGNPCTAGLLTQVGGGACGVHPSYAGQALLAEAVAKAIRLS